MDPTLDVLHSALNGLMTRQSVLANNIANASTPGFQASQVDFETTLRQAMANGTNPPMNAGDHLADQRDVQPGRQQREPRRRHPVAGPDRAPLPGDGKRRQRPVLDPQDIDRGMT